MFNCQYILISSETAREFSDQVNAHMKEGWIPYGELIITSGEKVLFSQQFLRNLNTPIETGPNPMSVVSDSDFGQIFESKGFKESDEPGDPEGEQSNESTGEGDEPTNEKISKKELIIEFITKEETWVLAARVREGLKYSGADVYLPVLAKQGDLCRRKNGQGKYEYGLPEWRPKDPAAEKKTESPAEKPADENPWKSARKAGVQPSADQLDSYLESHNKIIKLADLKEETGWDTEYLTRIIERLFSAGKIRITSWAGSKKLPHQHYGLKEWFDENGNVPRYRWPKGVS